MPRILILTFLLALAALGVAAERTAVAAPDPADRQAAELRALLERYWAAWAREDLDGALACVSAAEDSHTAMRDFLQCNFDANDTHRYVIEKFAVRNLWDDRAITRSLIRSFVTPNGAVKPEEGLQHWDFSHVLENGEWRIRGFRRVEAYLLERFRNAEDAAARAELLEDEREVVNGWLPLALREEANQLSAGSPDEKALEEAERVATIAFEAAEWMNADYERAYCHLMRGVVRRRRQKWNPALNDWEKARALFEKSNDKEGLAKVWRNSAALYHHVSEFDRSVRAYGLAIGHWRELKDEKQVAECLQDLGTVHQDAGRAEDALKVYVEALEIQRRLGGRKHEAMLLGNIAAIRQDQERYAEALELFEQAMKIDAELGNHAGDSIYLTNLGNLYGLVGQPREAERYLRAAVKAAEANGSRVNSMIALHNLCNFLARQGRADEALEAGYASMKIAHEIGDSRYEAQSFNTLGEVCYREGYWTQALDAYDSALDASRATGSRIQEGVALTGLAATHYRRGKVGRALLYYEQAQTLADRTGNANLQLSVARLRADLHRETGDVPKAAAFYRKAIAVVEQIRARTAVRSLQTSYLRQFSFLYHRLAECYVRLGDSRGAFAVSEQFRARALVDVIQSGMFRITRSMTEEERKREAELEQRLATVARALEKAVLSDEVERLKKEQDEARAELQKFQNLLYARLPQLRSQRAAFAPAVPEELAARLLAHAPDTAIVSYFVLPSQTLLFVIRRDTSGKPRLTMRNLPSGGDDLIQRANELWQACSTPGADYVPLSASLYRDLVTPALSDLNGIRHLILIPGSDLGNLPFAALKDEQGLPLVARFALTYAPSATALMHQADLASKQASERRFPLLAFGNPVFPEHLSELPATEGEVAEIARLFGKEARSFIRKEALESRAKELLGKARIVHFATHGTLDERAPMYSSVVLTRDDTEDGFLQARELAELDLAADLVVLSACETALGQKIRGEGIVGLAWALFVGGAASTVTSQWQVPDDSTRTLMVEFYRHLLRPGVSRSEAIRRAQLALFRDKRYAHPYHWAPFTFSGRWEPTRVAAGT